MKFKEWIVESEAAKNLEKDAMRLVNPPMSRAGFNRLGAGKLPHGEYKPKNFDRYSFKTNEQKVQEYSNKMKSAIFNSVLVGSEALAGFYENDAIVKALDDYLTELSNLGIKL